MFFTRWESRGYYISFVACRAEALAKAGQGFAVCDYSLTLDASDLPAETGSANSIPDFAMIGLSHPYG